MTRKPKADRVSIVRLNRKRMARVSYLLIQTFKEKQNEREKLRGTFQVLEGNILMLVHPLSGDNKFYKVRDANHIILMDSFGNESQKEDRKYSILKKKD